MKWHTTTQNTKPKPLSDPSSTSILPATNVHLIVHISHTDWSRSSVSLTKRSVTTRRSLYNNNWHWKAAMVRYKQSGSISRRSSSSVVGRSRRDAAETESTGGGSASREAPLRRKKRRMRPGESKYSDRPIMELHPSNSMKSQITLLGI